MLKTILKDFWLKSLIWSDKLSDESLKIISDKINNAWILDNYDSLEFYIFLCWEENLEKILKYKEILSPWISLDLDDTLSETTYEWFYKMSILLGNPENLSINELQKKYWTTKNVEYWKNLPQINDFIKNHVENNEFVKEFKVIENTQKIYKEIDENIVWINAYITARAENVKSGTLYWLEKHNFSKKEIILRPNWLHSNFGMLWKACVLDILHPKVLWIVDDSQHLAKLLPKRYNWNMFLFWQEINHFEHPNIHPSKDIFKVKENIKKVYIKTD